MRDRANDLTCSAFLIFYGMVPASVWIQNLWDKQQTSVNGWELIGPDCDPVYSICRSANTVYTYLIIYFILVLDVWFILHFHSLYCL